MFTTVNISSFKYKNLCTDGNCRINLFLTELEVRTGEYWPELVALWTERSKARTKTTEDQYFPVRIRSRASEVSKLFIIWHRFFERLDTSPLGECS